MDPGDQVPHPLDDLGGGDLLIRSEAGAEPGFQALLAIRPDGTPVELPTIRWRFGAPGESNAGGKRYRFLPNGKGVVYMQDEGTLPLRDFWLFDLATRQSRRLTRLANSGRMRTFDITPDGKQIFFDSLRENSDIVLIDLPR